MKTILVTGGAGFIGSHLCDRLLEDGNTVICLDNFFTGQKKNVVHLLDNPYFELVRHDVTQPYFAEVDEIYNLACPASPVHYQYNPIKTSKTSVMGTINMLGLAKRVKCTMLHASTSEVYGTAKYVPIDENHPLQPQSPYSATKIGADAIAKSFYNAFNLPVSIARPFNTYGPRQSARAVIPTIITQIASGKKKIKLGDTSPTRDFNYVKDTCSGFLAVASCENSAGQEFNIGSNYEISIGDTLNIIKRLMNSDVEFETDSNRIRPKNSEVNRLWCDNSKIVKATGFKPQYTLEEGLRQTIDWFVNPENLRKYKADIYNV